MSFFLWFSGAAVSGRLILLALSPLPLPAWSGALAVLPTDALVETSPADPAAGPADEFTLEAIELRRAEVLVETIRVRAELEGLPAEASAADATALGLTQELGLLARLDSLHAEQLRTAQHAADLALEAATLADLAANPRPPAVRLAPPWGLTLLDQLYAERDYLIRAETLLKTDLENVGVILEDARDEFAARERERRRAREALAKAEDPARAQVALRLAALESRVADETMRLAEAARTTLEFQQSLLAPKLARLLPDLVWLGENLVLSTDDLAAAEAKRAERIEEIDAALAKTRAEAGRVAKALLSSERRAADQVGEGELDARRADRQTLNLQLSALSSQRDRQAAFAEILERRLQVLGGTASTAEMRAWAKVNDQELERLAKQRRPFFRLLRASRQELQDLRSRLADSTSAARDQAWVKDRVGHLTTWLVVNERELADLSDLATARGYLKEEIQAQVFVFSWNESLTAFATRLRGAWDYEVFSIADQPIRVKTLLFACVLLLAGYWAARRISLLLGDTLTRRFGMNLGRRAAWQMLSFYALFLVVLIVTINLFHLSLTQFSVVSGALAVGIGFGSQTLIGNFISGIILMLERPVNQGDVIEINGQQMTVERLGPRSTLVRSYDNTHVIVPNSRLLEENVINWTLSDDVVRTRMAVGVAYGSPTREVERLLIEVMRGLPEVKREPAPLVIFTDFGDSTLQFQASFWSALAGRKEVESELRHRIAEAFAKAGISMAFPQRDVHLETSRPLRFELVRPGAAGREEPPAEPPPSLQAAEGPPAPHVPRVPPAGSE